MPNRPLNRRDFLAASIAAGAMASAPSLAQAATPYVLPEEFLPVEVRLKTKLAPGEIHVDPNAFRLFWTLPKNKAIKYAIGIGRPGLYESGEFTVGAKREWPSWTPTPAMIERTPSYARWEDGMPGGPNNPLGARALYLYTASGRDSYLRIHGTNQPHTIGTAVSNGCARLINAHAIDLYNRVPLGTRVVLYPKG